MYQREFDASIGVDCGIGEGCDHCHERHSVHVIGYGFGVWNTAHDPSGAFGGLELAC